MTKMMIPIASVLLGAMSFSTAEKAIDFFKQNKHELWLAEYHDDLTGVFRGSELIAKNLKDYLKYAMVQE